MLFLGLPTLQVIAPEPLDAVGVIQLSGLPVIRLKADRAAETELLNHRIATQRKTALFAIAPATPSL